MSEGFTIRCTTPEWRRGRQWAHVQALVDGEVIHAADMHLGDSKERAIFAREVKARLNGQAPEDDAIEKRLLMVIGEFTTGDAASDGSDAVANADAARRDSQATKIIALANAEAQFFHDEMGETYARIQVGAHIEVWPVHARAFRMWQAGRFYTEYQTAAGGQALTDALNVMDAMARFDGPCEPVYLRVAPDGQGGLYIDLADSEWRVVHVTTRGWEVVERPQVNFRRSAGTQAFPFPEAGGSLDDLRALVNVPDDDDWTQIKAWIIAAFREIGPYPVLAIQGPQGSAKTTLAKMVRQMVDPAKPATRSEPREVRDLVIAARASRCAAFDNVSHVQPWLSDALCRLSTGSGFATRELYSDYDEVLFESTCPVLLNGITEFITRGDLLDRTIQIVLPPIEDAKRQEERVLLAKFEQARPRLFGAVLDSVAGALRELPKVHLVRPPRMADFAHWAVAAERGRGESPLFLAAYAGAQEASHEQAIEASPIGPALLDFVARDVAGGPWEGTATDLLEVLGDFASEPSRRHTSWPKNARALSSELRRLAPALRATGVAVEFDQRNGHDRRRLIRVSLISPEDGPATPSAPSAPSASPGVEYGGGCEPADSADGADGWPDNADGHLCVADDATVDDPGGAIAFGPSASSAEACETRALIFADGADGADGVAPAFSSGKEIISMNAAAGPMGQPSDVVVLIPAAQIEAALPVLLAAPVIGLDCETTGLDPRSDRLRLVQLAVPDHVFILDCFRCDPRVLTPLLKQAKLIVGHNLTFDLQFLTHAGLAMPTGEHLFDTMLAAQLLGAGTADGYLGNCGLAALTQRLLGVKLDKAEQRGNWGGVLGEEQIRYAAMDAAVLLPLYEKLQAELAQAGLDRVARLEMRTLPGIVWMEYAGAPFDAQAWQTLSDQAVAEQVKLEGELTELCGARDLFGRSTVNWSSPAQVAELLRGLGHSVKNCDEASLRAIMESEPLAPLLLEYREASRRASTYGIEFLRNVSKATGRLHADFLQIGASSGRMACSRPNLQQIPRDPAYRACFRPSNGRVLVKADYSQIELRIAAQMANDRTMLEAYAKGEDLHKLTARSVLGKAEVGKDDRQAAKALNFGLLYGMGAATLREHAANSYGVNLSVEEATLFRQRFFETYRGLREWHRSQREGAVETRTLSGRRRLNVTRFTEKLNTPVQGTGADGLKAALALLWERRAQCPTAVPVLVVHDEIVVECDRAEAERAKEWVVECMKTGMGNFLRKVPVEVEAEIMADWSGTKVEHLE